MNYVISLVFLKAKYIFIYIIVLTQCTKNLKKYKFWHIVCNMLHRTDKLAISNVTYCTDIALTDKLDLRTQAVALEMQYPRYNYNLIL